MSKKNRMLLALVKTDKNHEMIIAGESVAELSNRIAGIKVVTLSLCYMLDI